MADEPDLKQDTLRALEWQRLLEALARHARSGMGAQGCRSLQLETDLAQATDRQRETVEMAVLQTGTDSFPALSFPDLRDVLQRTGKGGVLDTHELRDVCGVVRLIEDVIRYLSRHREDASHLAALGAPLPPIHVLSGLRTELEWAIDPEGTIKDAATPELRRLTQQAHDLKQQARHRLESILQSKRYEDILQERYFAQREGRYVVPVKTEMRTAVPGIVHDVSASGATVFLEPRELVELNNAIKVAELAVEREVRRILHELSLLVAEQAPALLEALDILARFDAIHAKAALAGQLRATAPALNDRGRIRLCQARHPLLALARPDVVPNDIDLDESVRTLVISGANTGGKTVVLKLLGLFALMVRAGLLLPCDEGSEMALFAEVYADIGDAQDLTRDLSSFSSHMVTMIGLLRLLSEAQRDGQDGMNKPRPFLLLLDEPMTSTDPAEGAALAQALLLKLAEKDVKAVVTTHYTELKVLAQQTTGFLNASVEFDVARLAPTYRLVMGIPGGSSAIEIAGRLGMDENLLEAARDRLQRDDQALERLLGDLQERQRRVAEEWKRVSALRAETEQQASEAAAITERLRASEQTERKGLRKRFTEELQRARSEIQSVLDELKRDRTAEKAKAAKERLAAMARQRSGVLAEAESIAPVDDLKPGDEVEIAGLGTKGVLLDAPAGKRRVRVRVGAADLSVSVDDLHGTGTAGPGRSGSSIGAGSKPPPHWSRLGPSQIDHVVDVRGKAADEALDEVIARLDQAVLSGGGLLRIIHGHGTGKLRTILRDYLKGSPYVSAFRAGDRHEGGDGVTLVELRI
ncbi:Endonuclease MutS2 [Nitrospira tepida]|uniref:Endonuclease MutS2 n=1 Tax=Nitrospira tepida TaxID=2973512 RepID=A0AA86T5X8_9BACT|nr:endonuclease MutS2 [Nitrospira tepida]CAI4030952.1 Endonuclease MutS2 [Nitrospira tepida]